MEHRLLDEDRTQEITNELVQMKEALNKYAPPRVTEEHRMSREAIVKGCFPYFTSTTTGHRLWPCRVTMYIRWDVWLQDLDWGDDSPLHRRIF